MQIKPKQTMAHNKLLLLYLLDSAQMRLNELQLIRIMDELGFMQFFDMQECLFELSQNNHITETTTPQGTTYCITEAGSKLVYVLQNDLRHSFREAIQTYITANKSELEKESQYVGEFIKLSDSEYRVTLKVLEHDRTVFEINLLMYSKRDAQIMTEKWRDHAVELYQEVLSRLV